MKEKKEKNIFKYFIKMFFIFIAIDLVITLVPSFLTEFVTTFKYGKELIGQVFYAIFALIIMLLFHNSYVFTDKQTKFTKAIMYGIPILAFSVVNLFTSIIGLEAFNAGNFINVVIYCVFIGITEEFLCRGWLLNEFLERYGETKKSVITSIALSSLIFGLIHLINVFSTTQGLFETLLQVVNAASLGFLLGSIYYKTKNIWSVIFLHAFYDFALFLGEINMVRDCTYNTPTSGVTFVNCATIALLSLFWILGAIYVLKKCNFPNKKATKKKNADSIIITCLIVVFCLVLLPYQNLVEGYDDYMVCYEYKETDTLKDYITHYPHYDEYEINYTDESSTLLMDDDDTNRVQEVIMLNNYHFKFSVNDVNKVLVENLNTGYTVTLDFPNVVEYGLEVIENNDSFNVVINTSDGLNDKVFFSDYLTKIGMGNDKEFLDEFAASFKEYDLPILEQLGYVTLEDSDYKYPFFYSTNYDLFMIKGGELFLVK